MTFEKMVYYSQFPRGGGMTHHGCPPPRRGKHQSQSGGRGRGGSCGQGPFCGFCGKEWLRQAPGRWYLSSDTSSLLRLSRVELPPCLLWLWQHGSFSGQRPLERSATSPHLTRHRDPGGGGIKPLSQYLHSLICKEKCWKPPESECLQKSRVIKWQEEKQRWD